jgi:hypothetical protein
VACSGAIAALSKAGRLAHELARLRVRAQAHMQVRARSGRPRGGLRGEMILTQHNIAANSPPLIRRDVRRCTPR